MKRLVLFTEGALQRAIIDRVLGRPRPLPTTPLARAVVEQLWKELDARPPGAIVDIPPNLP
jgi:uncharacterized protein YbjT (DUF2867 family)